MAPWAGRTRHGRFTFRDQRARATAERGDHAIHGTVRDRPWAVERAGKHKVHMSCDLGPHWPFAGWVEQQLVLHEDRLDLELSVHARDDAMPASCGWHPWWRRTLPNGATGELELHTGAMYRRDEDGIAVPELLRPLHPARGTTASLSSMRRPRCTGATRPRSPSRRTVRTSSCSTNSTKRSASSRRRVRPTRSITSRSSSSPIARSAPRRVGGGSDRCAQRGRCRRAVALPGQVDAGRAGRPRRSGRDRGRRRPAVGHRRRSDGKVLTAKRWPALLEASASLDGDGGVIVTLPDGATWRFGRPRHRRGVVGVARPRRAARARRCDRRDAVRAHDGSSRRRIGAVGLRDAAGQLRRPRRRPPADHAPASRRSAAVTPTASGTCTASGRPP